MARVAVLCLAVPAVAQCPYPPCYTPSPAGECASACKTNDDCFNCPGKHCTHYTTVGECVKWSPDQCLTTCDSDADCASIANCTHCSHKKKQCVPQPPPPPEAREEAGVTCAPGYQCYAPSDARRAGAVWVKDNTQPTQDPPGDAFGDHSNCDKACAANGLACQADFASFGGAEAVSSVDKLQPVMKAFGFQCKVGACWNGKSPSVSSGGDKGSTCSAILAINGTNGVRECYPPFQVPMQCGQGCGYANCWGGHFNRVCPCVPK